MSAREITLHRFAPETIATEWLSPWLSASFAATELLASWTASGAIRVECAGVTQSGVHTKWYVLGEWSATGPRSSVPAQGDQHGDVIADFFRAAAGHALTRWRIRVTLLDSARLHSVHVMASALPADVSLSSPLRALGQTLPVPRYSQRIHKGLFPQWDGGGLSWCSPTSTAMVLSYWDSGPTPADYSWVDPSYVDPWVIHAARATYDPGLGGCGNWPFNTAYAGTFGMQAFVTRLRSLNEAELFIEAGIPLIASATYTDGEVPGLDYGTNGHLMVLAGFTESGDPVLNDPNSDTNASVRKPVGRSEWESAWLRSSGVVYIIHPPGYPLPPSLGNW